MAIDVSHLRTCVVRPTLVDIGLWSPAAENLLLGTAAHESHLGTYLDQANPSIAGPAYGIYQMEPATHNDIWDNFLDFNRELANKVLSFSILRGNPIQLQGNLYYATAMARVHYLRVKEPLPQANDIKGLARYWKQYWNTNAGKGTVEQFEENYKIFVLS